ncbi:MAG TPA: hypothetical protein VFO97_10905, partial [Desertimonas sp.]|nr:hypothetical protein [Desertimonas sp.]
DRRASMANESTSRAASRRLAIPTVRHRQPQRDEEALPAWSRVHGGEHLHQRRLGEPGVPRFPQESALTGSQRAAWFGV